MRPLTDRAPRFADLVDTGRGRPAFTALWRSELIGRPLGDEPFFNAISRRLNRVATPRKRGCKPKGDVAGAPRQKSKDGRATVIPTVIPENFSTASLDFAPNHDRRCDLFKLRHDNYKLSSGNVAFLQLEDLNAVPDFRKGFFVGCISHSQRRGARFLAGLRGDCGGLTEKPLA